MDTNESIRLARLCMQKVLDQMAIDESGPKADRARRDIREAMARLSELRTPAVGSGFQPLGPAGNN